MHESMYTDVCTYTQTTVERRAIDSCTKQWFNSRNIFFGYLCVPLTRLLHYVQDAGMFRRPEAADGRNRGRRWMGTFRLTTHAHMSCFRNHVET
jgi:hypothetical protein